MRTLPAFLVTVLCVACVTPGDVPDAVQRDALAPTHVLRVGVYQGSPTSLVRDASGQDHGVAIEMGRQLAHHLAVPYRQVEFQRISEVLDAVKTGDVDFAISNATASRAKDVDFTQPVLSIELGYLVPDGSQLRSMEEVDRAGVRIGVTQGSTSQTTLPKYLALASVVPVANVVAAREKLSRGELEAFATNKAILFELADGMPGSTVLAGNWGVESVAVAIPKGRDAGLAYLRRFVEDAKKSGLVSGASSRAGLRGATAAPPGG
jgi:polar amino acid transport system substrate-binding protein